LNTSFRCWLFFSDKEEEKFFSFLVSPPHRWLGKERHLITARSSRRKLLKNKCHINPNRIIVFVFLSKIKKIWWHIFSHYYIASINKHTKYMNLFLCLWRSLLFDCCYSFYIICLFNSSHVNDEISEGERKKKKKKRKEKIKSTTRMIFFCLFLVCKTHW